jgi:hypothetical protein
VPPSKEVPVDRFLIASQYLWEPSRRDPYDALPSGMRRLLAAIGIVALIFIGLQSAASDGPSGYGLGETAFAAPQQLE